LCSGPDSEGSELLGVAATLLRDGYSPDLTPLYGEPAGPLQRVPPYVFDDTNRFWFDGPIAYPNQRAQARHVEQTDTVQMHDSAEGEVMALIADVGNYSVTALARSKRLADDLGYDSLLQLRLLDRLRTEYPQLHAVDIKHRVVIASNIPSIPPTCLDPLNITAKPQRAAAARHTIDFLELLWHRQQPQRAAESRPR